MSHIGVAAFFHQAASSRMRVSYMSIVAL